MNTSAKFHNAIFFILITFLFIPLFENSTALIHVNKLNGAVKRNDFFPELNEENWLTGVFQPAEQRIINDSCGFRNILVRIRNQIDFSLFNMAHAEDIVPGRNGYLFETHYLDGYYGNDFLGTESINKTIKKLEFINDTLKKLHKLLFLVIAPSKAMYYPEYLPEKGRKAGDSTNYCAYAKLLSTSGIPYVDFNSYFIASKYKSKYPLESKNGIHWSMYGASIAGDSIVKYIEKLYGKNIPEASYPKLITGSDSDYDIDIENTLNLLVNLPSPTMAYPVARFDTSGNIAKPHLMIVGDSYFWQLTEGYNITNAFATGSNFWYYFFKPDHSKLTREDTKKEIGKSDIVMMLATAHNLITLGWGFIDTTYYMFKGTYPPTGHTGTYIERVKEVKEEIKKYNEWLRQVEVAAEEQSISLDSALTLNAMWTVDHENGK